MFVLAHDFKLLAVVTELCWVGPVQKQDVVADSRWRAKLFAQWQQRSWGLGSRKQRQVIFFKDMSSMTHFLQLDPTSKVSRNCLWPIKL